MVTAIHREPLKPYLSPGRWVSNANWVLGPLIGTVSHMKTMGCGETYGVFLVRDMRERDADGLAKPVWSQTFMHGPEWIAEDAVKALQIYMRIIRRELLRRAWGIVKPHAAE